MAKHDVKRILIALAIPISLLFWSPVSAQNIKCFPYEAAIKQLEKNTSERMTAAGVDSAGNLVMLYTADSGGWTFVVRLVHQGKVMACPLSMGQGWRDVKPKRGSPS